MFIVKKEIKGKDYYYLRQSVRENGKVKAKTLAYLGKTKKEAAKIAKEQNTPIEGIIVNRIRSPKHEYNTNEIEIISDIPVMAKIRDHKKMAQALNYKTPITLLDSANTISKEIKRFASAICGSPEKEGFFQKLIPFKKIIQKEKINRELLREKFYNTQL